MRLAEFLPTMLNAARRLRTVVTPLSFPLGRQPAVRETPQSRRRGRAELRGRSRGFLRLLGVGSTENGRGRGH
jgi:hypothetical protein